jgi:hypothetical protein
MIDRKKKLRLIQFSLLIVSFFIIYFTYYAKEKSPDDEIISEVLKNKVKKSTNEDLSGNSDTFFDVEYTGLDLNGNRYLLKSEEADLDKVKSELVYMKVVEAIFYFKDNTTLLIWADEGIYNNNTLDMKFRKNVRAEYLESELFAEKADYSNTENYLSIYEDVRIEDAKGNLVADKLLFDITKQTLDITSFNNGRINANVNLDEKRF